MVTQTNNHGQTIYICDCGLGYSDILVAYACEEYRRVHGVNSEDIIKHAIYNPRSDLRNKIAPENKLQSTD